MQQLMTGRSDPTVARFGNMDKMNPGCFVGLNPGQDRRYRSLLEEIRELNPRDALFGG